jgi:predicted LPLAT superfamily acyltransferase
MFRRNAGALTRLLEQLNPQLHQNVIEIGETSGMLRVRECIARGEIVGILADRSPASGEPGYRAGERRVAVPFLGGVALFPAGPFVLAAMLNAPVVLFHAVRTGPQCYAVQFEHFADRVVLRRATRTDDLRAVVARYAAALERDCRAYPLNWFNFFSFWEHGDDADHAPDGTRPAGSVPTGSVPTGSVPTGSVPTGSVPTGSVPAGAAPAGRIPAGVAACAERSGVSAARPIGS